MMNVFSMIATLKSKFVVITVTIAFIAGMGYYLYTGKKNNPVTNVAADIIQKETGVDIEKILPSDNSTTP